MRDGTRMDGTQVDGRGERVRIRVANAPCSWGLIGGQDAGVPWQRMLDELAEAGYVGTELGDYGYMPTDPVALGDALRTRGLTMLGAYQGIDLRRTDAVALARQRLLATASLLAAMEPDGRFPYLILADEGGDAQRARHAGRLGPEHALDAGTWRTLARNAGEIARLVQGETGLATLFHPHCGTFVETPDETARLLDDTDADLLGLVFDTGHFVYGSGRPDPDRQAAVEGLARFWDRVAYVHLKDCEPSVAAGAREQRLDLSQAVRGGLFCELGKGSIDVGSVLAFLNERDYDGWVTVEQDVLPGMGTPAASARRNREFLAGLGL